jgi:two-component system, probable response regulator PhcQ
MTTTEPIAPITRLLIVDDEAAVLAALQRALRRQFGARLRVETQTDAQDALLRLRDEPFDIVLSDLRMPEIDGITLLTLASAIRPRAVRMLLTGSADFETAQRAINEAGLFRYLTKPWVDSEIAAHLETAIAEVLRLKATDAAATATESPQERERQRLESLEPGLTQVDWGPQGEVLMPPVA